MDAISRDSGMSKKRHLNDMGSSGTLRGEPMKTTRRKNATREQVPVRGD